MLQTTDLCVKSTVQSRDSLMYRIWQSVCSIDPSRDQCHQWTEMQQSKSKAQLRNQRMPHFTKLWLVCVRYKELKMGHSIQQLLSISTRLEYRINLTAT